MTSKAASAAAAIRGPPAKVEPWSPRSRTSPGSGVVTQAPTGSPPPSAFAGSSRRAARRAAHRPRASPVRPIPVWISSKTSRAPALVAGLARAATDSSRIG